jgi:ketosteroid isomerase-like protein
VAFLCISPSLLGRFPVGARQVYLLLLDIDTLGGAMRKSIFATVMVLAAACQPAETPDQMAARIQAQSDSARTAIESQLAVFARAAAAGNVDSMVSLYADDAVVMPPSMPAITARDSIRAMLGSFGPFTITFNIQSVWASGDHAIERGTWAMGAPAPGAGKYLSHWQRGADGQWRMVADIWNDDAPPAPPPPTARRR